MKTNAVFRIRLITGAIILLAFILIARLYVIQIVQGTSYREEAENQYVYTVRDLYSRGSIYLTTKANEYVSAATIQSGFLLAINPTLINDPLRTYDVLNTVVSLDQERFLELATRKSRPYQEVKQHISQSDAEKIKRLELDGVQLYRNQWRYYPGDELAARTIGFVGYRNDDVVGLYGLERYYNDVLLREDEHLAVNFFAELFSNLGSLVFNTQDDREGDIITSIEPTVARMLDKVLGDTQTKWDSKLTGGIIINPSTGDIYALGVTPSFNLNDRSGVDISAFSNPLTENVYEFGSIIKPLTIAAGLDSGAITPESTYYDAGRVKIDGYTVSNYDGRGRGTVDIQQILSQSLNVGAAHVASVMGKETFRKYFLNLKLGSETGIDLPGETYGLVDNLNSPRDIEYATASFGQGIALTPIAAARALASLSSGKLSTPHIVQRFEYKNGTSRDVVFPDGERVFKKETGEDITRMLVEVVDKALRGGTVAKKNYSIAAKTGTAQIADEVNGGYYDDRFLHSFFGYFPAYDPKFLIFLYTVEPKGVKYASQTLTAPFMELTDFLINYYDIPPDR